MPFDLPFDLSLDMASEPARNILVSVLLVVAAAVLIRGAQRLALRYIDEPSRRYHTSKLIGRLGGLLTVVTLLVIWSFDVGTVLGVLTVIGAGVAISLREAFLSAVGWLNIVARNPFRQGDRIEIGGVRGDVVDIRLLHSTLMEIGGWVDADQSTGRLVHIPNAWIYQHPVYNYTHGFNFIWNELPFTVTFRSDWEAAREIILSLAEESASIVAQQAKQEIRQLSREYLVHYSILTPFVYVDATERGIRLTLRYLCEVRKRRGTTHALTMGILRRFAEHGRIEMAYPTTGIALMDGPQWGPLPPNGDASPDAQSAGRATDRPGASSPNGA